MTEQGHLQAVIMVGGKGKRLRPFTHCIPKPLLPIGKKPILQLIIEQLKRFHFKKIYLITGYGSDLIKAYFQNGEKIGVDIKYISEETPLGTLGGVFYLKEVLKHPFLLMNGDLLTNIDYFDLYQYHLKHNPDISVVIKEYEIKVPYGIVETDGLKITTISEKPILCNYINIGIYFLSPRIFNYLSNTRIDMTDFIQLCLKEGRDVISYKIDDDWIDIGQIKDYEYANKIFEKFFM